MRCPNALQYNEKTELCRADQCPHQKNEMYVLPVCQKDLTAIFLQPPKIENLPRGLLINLII